MYKVLLVDDEPIVKIALRTMIDWENLGFVICGTAADGVEALHIVNEHMPDIIITDLKMPNMDGLQLIRELKDINYGGKVLVASNFGEYELVREALLLGAVDYLLKISIQTDLLVDQLNKIVKLIEQEKHLLQEEVTKENTMINHMQKVKKTLLRDYFTVPEYDINYLLQNNALHFSYMDKPCSLLYLSLYGTTQKANTSSKVSLSFMEHIILNLLELETEVEIFQIDKSAIIILISEVHLNKFSFNKETFSQRIHSLIKLYMTINPIIVYSSEVIGYDELRQAYLMAKESALLYFYEREPVMKMMLTSFNYKIGFTNFMKITRFLLQYIADGRDEIKLEQYFSTFIAECHRNNIHPNSLKALVMKSIDSLSSMDEKMVIDNMDQYEAIMKKIDNSITSEGLLNHIKQIMNEFKIISPHSTIADQVGIRKEVIQVIDFINNHYKDKLTLERIAEQVNFSENYLCKVFREQTGVSLMGYINTVRLNKAAEIIAQGNTYIKEVSNLVGIKDQFYFSRMFKRHFGVSPTDYNQASGIERSV